MDNKRVIFAIAGSGKTTYIINQLNLNKKSLVITHTINNIKNLRDGILRKFEYFPDNIILLPYFTFIYSICYRPFLSYKLRAKGINYNRNANRSAKQTENKYYIDKYNRLYSNRIAKLLESKDVLDNIISRLSKYFDNLFIDEVQDFAGHDFNFLKVISKANIEMIFVGDFYQHTFDTSRDGTVNKSLHDNYNKYMNAFTNMGLSVDCGCLNKSYRCSPTICNFIYNKMGIEIYSHKSNETKIIFIETLDQADDIYYNNNIVKLFYKEHYKYNCFSRNWGDCKGEDKYGNVCIVLNKIVLNAFKKQKIIELAPQTKNKLYVACTRAKDDLYFVSDEFYKKYKR